MFFTLPYIWREFRKQIIKHVFPFYNVYLITSHYKNNCAMCYRKYTLTFCYRTVIVVRFWWIFHFDGTLILMELSFWWNIHFDGTFILMEHSFWWNFHFDGTFILMELSFWWNFHFDGTFILMELLFWWNIHFDGTFILMELSFWWNFHFLDIFSKKISLKNFSEGRRLDRQTDRHEDVNCNFS